MCDPQGIIISSFSFSAKKINENNIVACQAHPVLVFLPVFKRYRLKVLLFVEVRLSQVGGSLVKGTVQLTRAKGLAC